MKINIHYNLSIGDFSVSGYIVGYGHVRCSRATFDQMMNETVKSLTDQMMNISANDRSIMKVFRNVPKCVQAAMVGW